jgi:membrane glycosyltransferase
LCQKLQAFGKIFYRKRHHAINGKSGNIADFCRRWGKLYRYMIILDADSIMSGATMVQLGRAMEANPKVGILQTQPCMVLGQSLFRRVLQFSSRVYGTILSQGSSLAQMSAGSYWGHNAIIRIAPFMEYCALPVLPVPDAKARHILSHDTIEAALMQRAGYEVWIAYDEPDSYEEGPPNLSDMLKRDRRWCAGNLQHFWFLFARGIKLGNRLQIWIGLMSYLCSPIWLIFLVAGCFSAYDRARFLTYSADPADLAAAQHAGTSLLLIITMLLLFLPRVLGVISSLPYRQHFGGVFCLLVSACFETLISLLLAPVLMLFHTLFVLQALLGWQLKWTNQNRTDTRLSFLHCLKLYGWQSCLGMVTLLVVWSHLGFSYWCVSIAGAWLLAPLTAWISSSPHVGKWLQSRGWLLIPEESEPSSVLQGLLQNAAEPATSASGPLWIQAILCPYVQAVHLSMGRQRAVGGGEEKTNTSMDSLRERLLREGPATLSLVEKQRLLWDADTVFRLHKELWSRPASDLHPSWEQFQFDCGKNDLFRKYLTKPVTTPGS